jgi:endonuclease/exonuclease/phosphatase family metal-dependent hydrolase
MRILSIAVLLVICIGPTGCMNSRRASSIEVQTHVVMSYNIRVNVASDGDNAWPHRADRVAALMKFHGADVAGLQEATDLQIQDLIDRLPEYEWYGVGRDDGGRGGEFVPVFFRRGQFEAIDSGTFWLSSTPEAPGSVGWDAALPRVTSWILLKDLRGRQFFVFNTHFDHRGEMARAESARLLWRTVRSRAGDLPAIVMGDFNARPDAEPYRVMTQARDGVEYLRDAATVVTPYGPDLTFGTFEVGKEQAGRIDYIFVTPGIGVVRTGILTDQLGGRYPSDHLPVLTEVAITK